SSQAWTAADSWWKGSGGSGRAVSRTRTPISQEWISSLNPFESFNKPKGQGVERPARRPFLHSARSAIGYISFVLWCKLAALEQALIRFCIASQVTQRQRFRAVRW